MTREPAARPRVVSILGVAVASLLCANGAVAAERLAGRDLTEIVAAALRPDSAVPGPARGANRSHIDHVTGHPVTSTTGEPEEVAGALAPGSPSTAGTSEHGGGGGASSGPAASPSAGSRKGDPTPTTTGGVAAPGGAPLAAGGGGGGGSSAPGVPGAGAPRPTQPGTAPVGDPVPPLEKAVSDLTPFVEREAGLKFKRPVPVLVMSGAELSARLAELNSLPRGRAAEQLQGVYRGLAIIPPTVNLESELAKFSRVEVPTFYDPVAQQLLVRSAEPTPHLLSMLVRELTRALDDQWFDIYRPELEPVSEAREGLKALVHGDARRVLDRFVAGLSADQRSQVEAENKRLAAQLPQDIDPAVFLRFTYPTSMGPNLVSSILAAGGRARLDAAFAHPPTTSEHVFLPERFLAGEQAIAVADPEAGGAVESRGTLGHAGLLVMLSQAIDINMAKRATDGWGGDRYVSWREGDLTCVRATLVADTPQDTTELGAALAQWAAKRPGSEFSGTGPFTIKRCG